MYPKNITGRRGRRPLRIRPSRADSYNYALRITHCIKPQQAGERLPCLINIHIAVTRKLLIVSLLVELSLNLDRETEEVDEACGISLIVNLISVECSNFLIVECVR